MQVVDLRLLLGEILLMAQQAICTSLPVLLVAYCVLRGLRMRPRGLAHLQHVDLQFVETRLFVEVGGETAVPGQQFVARNASSGLLLFHEHPVTRHQLLPRYPGGSADRRVCLEDTKKDSTASGARSWTAAAHEAGTHRTP